MNRKRWGLSLVFVAAIFALVMLLPDAPFAFVAGAVSEAEIPAVLPARRFSSASGHAAAVPDGILRLLLLFTFFMHLVLVDILLGSTLLAIVERKNFVEDGQGAYLPKILALTVNFGIAPFLFLQIVYGNFLYSGVVLMAVWWLGRHPLRHAGLLWTVHMRGGFRFPHSCAGAGGPFAADDGLHADQCQYPDAAA